MIDPLVLESVERLCAAEIHKYQREEYYNTVPRELFSLFCNAGLGGLSIPEEFGGMGASASTTAAILETIARFDLGPAIFISVHAMVSGLIARYGSDEQKKELLPKLASGEFLAAFALTEPQAGSDAAAITTEAELFSGSYKLRGTKCFITSAGFADLYLVFARTQDGPESKISAFMVPATTPGLSIGKPERKMGCELSPIASLFFDEATVPEKAILGPLHDGFRAALSGLAGGRINIAACANGISETAITLASRHLQERKQFGHPLAHLQGLQFMVADMFIQLEAARTLTQRAAEELDEERSQNEKQGNARLTASIAKCFATDAAMRITTDAVQLLGGAGYIKDYHVERLMRDAKMLQIVEGANQVQRHIIAREILQKD